MLQKLSFLRWHPFALFATGFFVVFGCAIYIYFFLDWVEYPEDENSLKYCYSPNHEYYITMWQSPWASHADEKSVRGTAKLYDKTGKLLYSHRAYISFEFGPRWFDGPAAHHWSVAYLDGEEPGWYFILPSSPGHDYSGPNRVCY
jgi:hypothetical protein